MKNFTQLKTILIACALALSFGTSLFGQTGTTVSPGGLAFVHFRVNQNTLSNRVAFIVRQPIAKGTVLYFTNRLWEEDPSTVLPGSWSNQQTDGVGTVTLTLTEDASIGQALFLTFTASSATSSFGTAAYINHNSGDFTFDNKRTNIYVYQGTDINTPTNFVTQVAWKTAASAANTGNVNNTTKLNFTATTGRTAYALGINGQSDKCGCWIQYVSGTAMSYINFSADLANTFYSDLSNGQFITATSASGAANINPCEPEASANSPFSFIANNILFDYYRYGHPADKVGGVNKWGKASIPVNSATWSSAWSALDGTDNPANNGTPDWSTVTQNKRVYLYADLALDGMNNGGGFNSSSTLSDAEGIFKAAQLFLVDSANDGVTLTIHPGSTLSVQDSVAMINKDVGGTATPKILLKSAVNGSGQMFYGQIAPTAATLQGTYAYELYIKNEDWHHIASPISSTLSAIQFTQQTGATETFSFNYNAGTNTGTNENCNVFYWDVNKTGGSFWQPATSSTDISAQPLTIFFSAAQVPCVMTITGTVPQAVRNPNITLAYAAANTSAGSDVSSGYGAPDWVGAGNKNGWNFYANPFLSFVSTDQLMANYASLMSSVNSSLYAWRPNLNGINDVSGSSGNYLTHNGNTGDANAAQIPPFQAVFMQASGSGANSGLNVGKKARTTGVLASVLNKKSNPVLALTLARVGSNRAPENIYLDVREQLEFTQNGRVRSDAPAFGTAGNVFAILKDSTFYKIKTVLYHADSLHQKVCVTHTTPEEGLVLRNHPDFDPNYVSFVYDRYTKKLTNLSVRDYYFDNDVMSFDYRFDWFLIPQSNTMLIDAMENPVADRVWATTVDDGVVLQANEFWKYPSSEVNVYSLAGELLLSTSGNVHNMFIPSRGQTEMVLIVIDDEVSIKAVLP